MHYLFSGTHATENTGTDRPKYAAEVFYNEDPEKGHSIFDFTDEIDLIPKSNNNGTYDGKYHIQYEEKPSKK